MFGALVDALDRRMASAGPSGPRAAEFAVGADRLDPALSPETDLAGLIAHVERRSRDLAAFYAAPPLAHRAYEASPNRLAFPSAFPSGVAENDRAYARIWRGDVARLVVAILRHWNAADADYLTLARAIHRLGYAVALPTLPWHGARNRPGALFSDDFLSPDLGRTVASVRQAVSDLRRTLDWFETLGHPGAILIGASLGTSVASMTAAADSRVRGLALLLTAGDFAEVVWRGSATRHIRAALEPHLTLGQLQAAWRIIAPVHFLPALAQRPPRMLLLSARRDTVVAPDLTAAYLTALRGAGLAPRSRVFGCGHYSLAAPPFNLLALGEIRRFLR